MKNFKRLFLALLYACLFSFFSAAYAKGNCTAIVQNQVKKTVAMTIYTSSGNFRALEFSGGANCSPSNTALGNPITCVLPPSSRFFYIFSHTDGWMTATIWMTVGGARSGNAIFNGSSSPGQVCGDRDMSFENTSEICASGVCAGVWKNNIVINPQ